MEQSKVTTPRIKRMFDILLSILLLAICSPVFVIISIAIILESLLYKPARGPIFYRETRISAGDSFIFFKFRIFKVSALKVARNANGIIHTKELEHNFQALTFVGRMLKQCYMDELPQLINIVRGDMSFVGPRPSNPEVVARLVAHKKYSKVLIRAGLTGYFQAHKGSHLRLQQNDVDMEYVEFVRTNSGWRVVLYDLKIIFMTIATVLRAQGI